MEDIDRTFDNQALMALGIYSFLDNLLARIPSTTDEASDNSIPNFSNSSEMVASNLLEDPSDQNILLAVLPRTEAFMLRHERLHTPSNHDDSSADDSPSVIYGGIDSHDSDENTINNDLAEEPQNVEAGGYIEDLFLYLSDKEREEFTCSVCYCIIKNVYQCQNEHRFCYGCIYTWSTGRGTGHNCCPMCRCDGLYAKNEALDERIKSKRVRCKMDNCNWLGFLREYPDHEHRYYGPKELNLFSKNLLEKLQKKTCVKFPTINSYDFCDDLTSPVHPMFLPQSVNQPTTAMLEPLQVCNRIPANTNDVSSDNMTSPTPIHLDSEYTHLHRRNTSGSSRRSPYTLRPLRDPVRQARLSTLPTEVATPISNLPPLLTAPVLTHAASTGRSAPGQRTSTRTRPNTFYPREVSVSTNFDDQLQPFQTTLAPSSRSQTEDTSLPTINFPDSSSTLPLSLPRLNLNQSRSRLSTNPQPREENSLSRGDEAAPQPLVYRRLVQPRHGAVLEQLRDTREQLTAMLRLMSIALEERRQNVLRVAASTTRLQIPDSLSNADSFHGNQFQVRNRRLNPTLDIERPSPSTPPTDERTSQEDHNTVNLFNGHSFALQHLARLQRIERILNEMNEPVEDVSLAGAEPQFDQQRVLRDSGWYIRRRERLELEANSRNPLIIELPSYLDTDYLPTTRRQTIPLEETRSGSIWSSDDDEDDLS